MDPDPEDMIQLVINGTEAAKWWLTQGVTTVRDMGMAFNLDLGLRNLIDQGKVLGPRILGSGRPICYPGWQLSTGKGHEINSPSEARSAARAQIRAGANQLKMFASSGIRGALGKLIGEAGWEQLTVEEMRAVVLEAYKAGLKVGVHAIGTQSVMNAIDAGADSIEHGTFADDKCITMMKEKDIFLIPTLASNEIFLDKTTKSDTERYLEGYARRGVIEGEACVQMASEVGVRIAAGTDFSQEGALAHECASLNEAGLSPMQVIQAATKTGAELLGMEAQIGTLEVGKVADFIALDGNPLEDISALEKIGWVIKNGQVVIADGDDENRIV
jgi:imidazolonepropionase-like amidohydrolase